VGLDLDLGGSSLLLSSVFGVEDGVGPDRPAINVVGVELHLQGNHQVGTP